LDEFVEVTVQVLADAAEQRRVLLFGPRKLGWVIPPLGEHHLGRRGAVAEEHADDATQRHQRPSVVVVQLRDTEVRTGAARQQ